MRIEVCAPSYRRPSGVEVLKYLPSCKIYVAESEARAYRAGNPGANIVAVPDKHQGNVSRIRNKILDDHKGHAACIVDDDLAKIAYWHDRERIVIKTEEDFKAFLFKYTVMALDLGVKLWGINVNSDKQVYREYTPFSLSSYIGSPFMVHLDADLRFDERLPLKEDYDFTLQNLNKYRKVLRVNRYYYIAKQMKQEGGCATYRNLETEREQFLLLQQKWGSNIIKSEALHNSRSHKIQKVRKFDVNPVMQVPIRGI